MHMTEGDLRATLDKELPEDREEQVHAHLADCMFCRDRLHELEQNASLVSGILNQLPLAVKTAPPSTIHSRLQRYIIEKENKSMFNKLSAFRFRLAAGALVLILLAAILAVPQVRVIATSFLGLFRVEQVAVIPINPSLFDNMAGDVGPQFQQMLSSDVKVDRYGENYSPTDAAEASTLVNFPLRIPTTLPAPTRFSSSLECVWNISSIYPVCD
jgi:hypothetical protein